MSHGNRDEQNATRRMGPQFSDPRPADPPPPPPSPPSPPINPPEMPADPPPAEKPLTDAEVVRLKVLRAMPATSVAESEEMKGLVAREHAEPAPLEPLTEEEAKRLDDLSTPRTLTEAELAEQAALTARAGVPRPVRLTAEERVAHLFDALEGLAAVVASLAAMVPAGHTLYPRMAAVRGHLDMLRRASSE